MYSIEGMDSDWVRAMNSPVGLMLALGGRGAVTISMIFLGGSLYGSWDEATPVKKKKTRKINEALLIILSLPKKKPKHSSITI